MAPDRSDHSGDSSPRRPPVAEADSPPNASSRPTIVRHYVVLACMLMAMLLYLDRFCVGIAQPFIQQDLKLSTFQMGFFYSAFFLTYALFQVPSGWMTDRFGSRIMLTVYVVTWSVFTAMMGLSHGFVMLLVMRAAYGLGQAGAYPTSASVLSKWAPLANRGMASGLIAVGGRMGGALAPFLTAILIVYFVPVQRPSQLRSDDLLDVGALSAAIAPATPAAAEPAELVDPAAEPVAPADVAPSGAPAATPQDRIWRLLPETSRAGIQALAEKHRAVAAEIKKLEKEGQRLQQQWRHAAAQRRYAAADALRVEVSDDDRELLLGALNHIIESDNFVRQGDLDTIYSEITVEKAARKFALRQARGDELSSDERQRMNRLLLEGSLGSGLGKVYVAGWRPVLQLYGWVGGLIVALIVWITLRNHPEEHPRCNAAEVALIQAGQPPGSRGKVGRVPLARLATNMSLWMNSITQIGTNIGWVFIVTWFPDYLDKNFNVSLADRGMMTSIPLLVGWFGMVLGGKLTDYFVTRVGLKWGRRIPWGGSRFIAVAAFLACPDIGSAWLATIAMSVVAFSTDLGTASGWAFCQDIGGRHVGSVLGWGNMWGNLGATVSPILLAFVVDGYGYNTMFYVCAAAFLVAGVCGLLIDATKPLEPAERAAPRQPAS